MPVTLPPVTIKRRDPNEKARHWVVEVCHSGFNRFRKLLVRYEKIKRMISFIFILASLMLRTRISIP
jgi:hypothetical protein